MCENKSQELVESNSRRNILTIIGGMEEVVEVQNVAWQLYEKIFIFEDLVPEQDLVQASFWSHISIAYSK